MRTTQPPLTEPVAAAHCAACGQPVLRAHADGIYVKADPRPLTITDEIRAQLAGRGTYELITFGDGHCEFLARTVTTIRAGHASAVVGQHHCTGTRLTPAQVRNLPPAEPFTTRARVEEASHARPPY